MFRDQWKWLGARVNSSANFNLQTEKSSYSQIKNLVTVKKESWMNVNSNNDQKSSENGQMCITDRNSNYLPLVAVDDVMIQAREMATTNFIWY